MDWERLSPEPCLLCPVLPVGLTNEVTLILLIIAARSRSAVVCRGSVGSDMKTNARNSTGAATEFVDAYSRLRSKCCPPHKSVLAEILFLDLTETERPPKHNRQRLQHKDATAKQDNSLAKDCTGATWWFGAEKANRIAGPLFADWLSRKARGDFYFPSQDRDLDIWGTRNHFSTHTIHVSFTPSPSEICRAREREGTTQSCTKSQCMLQSADGQIERPPNLIQVSTSAINQQ